MHLAQHRLGKITVVRDASRGGEARRVGQREASPNAAFLASVSARLRIPPARRRAGPGAAARQNLRKPVGSSRGSKHRRRDQRNPLLRALAAAQGLHTPARVRPARAVANDEHIALTGASAARSSVERAFNWNSGRV